MSLRREALIPQIIHWRRMRGFPDLRFGDLHLWRIRTDDRGKDLDRCLSLLGEHQRARAQHMRLAAHRERYVRAQAGLREILAGYLNTPAQDIAFDRGPAGKPSPRASPRPLSFNLTTTGDLALVGLCAGTGPDSELGVDCEWIRPRIDVLGVAERMFSPETVRELAATAEPERLGCFYRAWTALEADAKADGRGLFRPRAPGAARPQIAHCLPASGYIAAVARAALPPVSDWLTFELGAV